jgi:hypothetical protein
VCFATICYMRAWLCHDVLRVLSLKSLSMPEKSHSGPRSV